MVKAMKLPAGTKLPGTDLDIAVVEEIFAIWQRLSPEKKKLALAEMKKMVA